MNHNRAALGIHRFSVKANRSNSNLILLSGNDADEPMRHESKFAAWIRSGGNSVFVLPLGPVQAPEVKFSVVPDRLLDSIIDDALAAGVARLNGFLPEGVSIDITSVDLTTIRDQLRTSVADRLNETSVPVNPNDPVINAILARYTYTNGPLN